MNEELRSRSLAEGTPRYQQVADMLRADILSGRYAVGSHLPAEYELCERYSISRYTVREALRLLQEQGLVSRRQGAPTMVCAVTPRLQYHQSVSDLNDLLHYREVTRFRAIASRCLPADARLADWLELEPGAAVVHVQGMRHERGSDRPVCLTDVYASAARTRQAKPGRPAEQVLVELIDAFGVEHVGRVEQTLSAVALDAEQAKALESVAGAPALHILRRYFDPKGRLQVVATSLHSGDRFSFSSVLRRS